MAELRWIQTSLIVTLLLQVPAVTRLELVVRDGDEVTLPCGNIRDHHGNCAGTNWIFLESPYSSANLVVRGQTQSDRLRLSENCSLVLKKVSHEEGGQYSCTQDDTSGRRRSFYQVHLAVVTMTEQEVGKNMTLNCSVSSPNDCKDKVRWLFRGHPIGKDNGGFKTSQSGCSATVSFLQTHFISKNLNYYLKCEVNGSSSSNKQLFYFSPRSSGKKTSTSGDKETTSDKTAAPGGSALTFIMLLMRVAELLLLTVITVLLIRAAVKQRAAERSPAGRRSGAAATQVQRVEDEDEGPVDYENSVRLH